MTIWKELSPEEKAFRKSKEAFLERLKDVTTLVRSADSTEFGKYSDLISVVDKIFEKVVDKKS